MNQVRNKQGFTIIELTISMAFIAMLLLGIATLTLLISSVYNKGLTLRAVNESGQLIAGDIQRTLNSSVPSQVLFVGNTSGRRLCANNIVYAWNYAGSINGGFNRPGDVRMVRFIGDDTFCKPQPPSGQYKDIPSTASTTELLKAGDNTLAVHDVTFTESAVTGDDTQRLYRMTVRLGSNDTEIIASSGCQVPESRTDDEYCAVNEFTFTARAGNRGSTE